MSLSFWKKHGVSLALAMSLGFSLTACRSAPVDQVQTPPPPAPPAISQPADPAAQPADPAAQPAEAAPPAEASAPSAYEFTPDGELVNPSVPLKRNNAQRSFHLDGHPNTRDLGGLPAKGGYIRDGKLFRTGRLSELTDNDVNKIKDLGFLTIIDLRMPDEIEREGHDRMPDKLANGGTPHNVDCEMCNHSDGPWYVDFFTSNPESVSRFFHLLADENNYPIDFHCSAGKDRTGTLAAATLELLGTPRDIIMSDFLYTNHRELEVHEQDMQALFDFFDESKGVENFLRSIGITDEEMANIRTILIEPDQSAKK